MARELITSWGDYQTAIDRLLALAGQAIFIYDDDLKQLKLESRSRLDTVTHFLQANRATSLQIAVRNAEPIRNECPQLCRLLRIYQNQATARQTPEDLAHLRDSMLIIDKQHALIRFEKNLPRSKLLIDEPGEVSGYLGRFLEIYSSGGEMVTNSTLGL